MKHLLPELPYPTNALEPHISAETLEFHHGKHHKAYVEKLNRLIAGTEFERATLEDIVRRSHGPTFNNAAQAWNHDFYWKCLIPASDNRAVQGALAQEIDQEFGSVEKMISRLCEVGVSQFGSGWAWLALEPSSGKLSIFSTSNADNPLRMGLHALLCVDVWEHAYYIDYRNERERFLNASAKLLNWEFAERQFTTVRRIAA